MNYKEITEISKSVLKIAFWMDAVLLTVLSRGLGVSQIISVASSWIIASTNEYNNCTNV